MTYYGDKNDLSINEKNSSVTSTEIETSVLIKRGIANILYRKSQYILMV